MSFLNNSWTRTSVVLLGLAACSDEALQDFQEGLNEAQTVLGGATTIASGVGQITGNNGGGYYGPTSIPPSNQGGTTTFNNSTRPNILYTINETRGNPNVAQRDACVRAGNILVNTGGGAQCVRRNP